MASNTCYASLSDDQLIVEVKRLVATERHATAALVRALIELDTRRLYLADGCSSLFTYCTQVLHLADGAAYNRIEAARAARKFPQILEGLDDGSLTLTAVRLLSRHLKPENVARVLGLARFKVKREIEEIVASLDPRDAAPTIIRKLPDSRRILEALPVTANVAARTAAGPVAHGPAADLGTVASRSWPTGQASASRMMSVEPLHSPASPGAQPFVPHRAAAVRPAVVQLAPERYRLQLTISRATHDKLRLAQDLARHSIPGGDLSQIVDRALTLLLADLERRRCAATAAPRPSRGLKTGSRHIPATVKRAVWRRDAGRCAFVGKTGRCTERTFLEFHHVLPYAAGGAATTENIELRCRAHNNYEAVLFFAPEMLAVQP